MKTSSLLSLSPVLLLLGIGWQTLYSFENTRLRAPVEFQKSILDAHTHIACLRSNGCYIRPEFKNSYKFKFYMKASGLNPNDLERSDADETMLNIYIDRLNKSELYGASIAYGLDGFYDSKGKLDREKTDVLVPNSYVFKATQMAKNVYFGASINPNKQNALGELELVHSQGAKLIKWIPCTMGIDLKNMPPHVDQFLNRMKELDIPLVTHVGGENTFSWADEELCDPRRIERVLQKGLTVIAAHGAISGKFDGKPGYEYLVELMHKYPNLYVDNSAGLFVNRFGFYKEVFQTNFNGRALHGTDYPLSYISFAGFQAISLPQFKGEMDDFWYNYARRTKSIHDLEAAIKLGLGATLDEIKMSYDIFNIPYKNQ